ncbi:hypothetical protein [Actinomyces bowdenii]|uniref:Uncharacterized protein n=1 Tax=Actinomyces bowdenii TaxID=131109 RepID=A0A853EMY4_9ACTO|nr:hypothetical protein [Actinomyces bowdenii]MBF0697687.1 hypothetical protein [Actinomyces bowdenii]NYS69860.1 hypothetical protein [Actinomyces bowdenii]
MTLTPFRYAMDEAILSELRAAILHSGMPHECPARTAGMCAGAVSCAVTGRTALTVGELGAIASALGTTGADLMERAECSLADRGPTGGPTGPTGPPAGSGAPDDPSMTVRVPPASCCRPPGARAATKRQPGAPWGGPP